MDVLPEKKPSDFRLAVRLSPKSSRNAIGKWMEGPDGQKILKASVTDAPERGKANDALIRLLSKEWDIPLHRIILTHGHTDRNKILIIKGLSKSEKMRILPAA